MKFVGRALWVSAFLLVTFFSYGLGRTMYESVGFNSGAFAYGILLSTLSAILVFTVSFWVFRLIFGMILPSLSLLIFSSIIGILIAEVWILNDELNFVIEADSVARRLKNENFSRPRSWPHSSGALLWARERGVWSTD